MAEENKEELEPKFADPDQFPSGDEDDDIQPTDDSYSEESVVDEEVNC